MTALWALLSGAWSKAAGVGAALAALLVGLAAVRRSGVQAQRLDEANQRERDRAKTDQEAADIAAMPDDDVARELRDRWRHP